MSVTFSELQAMLAARSALPQARPLASVPCGVPGSIEQRLQHLAQWQHSSWPHITRPRLALYTVTTPHTPQLLEKLQVGDHPLSRVMGLCQGDVRVYEMGPLSSAPLDEARAAHAISYGLMAIEENSDVLLLALLEEYTTLPLTPAALSGDAVQVMAAFAATGRADVCAALGATLAARMACLPVLAPPVLAELLQKALTLVCGEETTPVIKALEVLPEDASPLQVALTAQQLQGFVALNAPSLKRTTLSAAA